jgi:hypothetical protein
MSPKSAFLVKDRGTFIDHNEGYAKDPNNP